jgi:hypothetical protein
MKVRFVIQPGDGGLARFDMDFAKWWELSAWLFLGWGFGIYLKRSLDWTQLHVCFGPIIATIGRMREDAFEYEDDLDESEEVSP